jgi:hypothetical protein
MVLRLHQWLKTQKTATDEHRSTQIKKNNGLIGPPPSHSSAAQIRVQPVDIPAEPAFGQS